MFEITPMKLSSMIITSVILTLTVQSLPTGQIFNGLAGDKRDLHDLCGRWFCGHTKRGEEESLTSLTDAAVTNTELKTLTKTEEQKVHEQSSTTNDKRDLHDLCGRWFCGHTKKRGITLRDHTRSELKKSIEHLRR
ncbi:hypothetical protein K7432_012430 [Basidiobolus ranarum]|uniref:Uncharacterized protein n=1 Tax=Basidiobolus ranarum TaxID=34480 RepID=A0ABR2WKY9_9FUNG